MSTKAPTATVEPATPVPIPTLVITSTTANEPQPPSATTVRPTPVKITTTNPKIPYVTVVTASDPTTTTERPTSTTGPTIERCGANNVRASSMPVGLQPQPGDAAQIAMYAENYKSAPCNLTDIRFDIRDDSDNGRLVYEQVLYPPTTATVFGEGPLLPHTTDNPSAMLLQWDTACQTTDPAIVSCTAPHPGSYTVTTIVDGNPFPGALPVVIYST